MLVRVTGVLLAALVVVGVASCSGGGEDTITKKEYVTAAKPICAATMKKIDKAQDELDGTKAGALTKYAKYVAELKLDEVAKLREIGALPDEDAKMTKALAVYERTFTEWTKHPGDAGQSAANKELAAASKTFDAYGLKDCGLGL